MHWLVSPFYYVLFLFIFSFGALRYRLREYFFFFLSFIVIPSGPAKPLSFLLLECEIILSWLQLWFLSVHRLFVIRYAANNASYGVFVIWLQLTACVLGPRPGQAWAVMSRLATHSRFCCFFFFLLLLGTSTTTAAVLRWAKADDELYFTEAGLRERALPSQYPMFEWFMQQKVASRGYSTWEGGTHAAITCPFFFS